MDEKQKERIDAAVRGDAQVAPPKKKGKGCLIVITLLIVAAIGGCVVSMGNDRSSDVDQIFIEHMNTTLGGSWAFTMSDHRCNLDESLQEYIGTGSIKQGELQYTYSFRAYVQDNKVNFVKITVDDLLGNHIIDFDDIDAETAYLDSRPEQ